MADEDADASAHPDFSELVSREPSVEDLVELSRALNALDARYVVIGGFAMRAAGLLRATNDVDLLIATDLPNEALVYRALETLPDKAVRALGPGEVGRWGVVRVADEITVDLMRSGCGIDYAEAMKEVVFREVQGVRIPFASPRLLWRMKVHTHREKDRPDLLFLRQLFAANGETPPEC